MFHVRNEGERLRWGFNFYPLSNTYSRGFVFRGFGWRWQVRWSKMQGRICHSVERYGSCPEVVELKAEVVDGAWRLVPVDGSGK